MTVAAYMLSIVLVIDFSVFMFDKVLRFIGKVQTTFETNCLLAQHNVIG